MDSQGRAVLNVRSAEPFTDPVVDFLVDLRWNNGELIREYSLLLDPAGFSPSSRLAAAAAAAAAITPATNDRAATSQDVAPSHPPKTDEPRVAALTQETPATARPSKAAVEMAPGAVPLDGAAAARHRVAPRETLRGIVRRAGATTESHAQRMMIAIFRSNPHAFEGNINLLHVGAVLTMPSDSDLAAIDATVAKHEVRTQMAAWRLNGRPAAPTRVASAAVTVAAPVAVLSPDTAALKGRVQTLEQALDDMHKQLVTENAALQDLRQLAAHGAAMPAQAAAAAQAATTPNPGAASTAVAAPAADAAPAVTAPAPALHPSVTVEIMHADDRPAPAVTTVAPQPTRRMSSAGFLGPVGLAIALALAAFAYSRRRVLKALEKPPAPPDVDAHIRLAEMAAMADPPHPAREPEVGRAARTVEPPKPVAQAVRAEEPAEPFAEAIEPKASSDQTTQEMAIDAELLERSYLDALSIDTLGIDASDTARNDAARNNTAAQRPTGISATHETAGLDQDAAGMDTVALDASELDTTLQNADIHTAIIDSRKIEPAAVGGTNLDYNLLDLDATAEHIHDAHHVQMPSQLSDRAVVSERRMNIVDVLKAAIDRDPHRRDLRMKLVETYYSAAAMNQRSFLDVVKKLSREREFLSAEDWKQIVKMGKEIAPEDILFADASADDLANCA